jgi:hypothetical protein
MLDLELTGPVPELTLGAGIGTRVWARGFLIGERWVYPRSAKNGGEQIQVLIYKPWLIQ